MDYTSIFRQKVFGVAALGLAAFTPLPALAGHIYASNMALPYSMTVQLAGGVLGAVSSLAGQQILTVNNGSTYNPAGLYTLAAWCIDFPHHISIGSIGIDYTVGGLTDDHIGTTPTTSNPLSPLQAQEIGGLVRYGNQQMAIAPSNLLSAAVQAAIWNIEYGSHYSGSDLSLLAAITSLEAMAPSLSTTGGQTLNSFYAGSDVYKNQSLEIYVPEPMTISVMAVGLLGLAAVRRRHRQS